MHASGVCSHVIPKRVIPRKRMGIYQIYVLQISLALFFWYCCIIRSIRKEAPVPVVSEIVHTAARYQYGDESNTDDDLDNEDNNDAFEDLLVLSTTLRIWLNTLLIIGPLRLVTGIASWKSFCWNYQDQLSDFPKDNKLPQTGKMCVTEITWLFFLNWTKT
jgi:hypothetical protein